MAGKMQWRSPKHSLSSNAAKELYIQDPGHPWRHYRNCKHYTPDNHLSYSGMRTFAACKAMGYTLVPSNQPIGAVEWHQLEEETPAANAPADGIDTALPPLAEVVAEMMA